MPFPANPLVNGSRPQYSRISFAVGNRKAFPGIMEISYKDSCEPGEARANQKQILGKTDGEYKAEGSFSIYIEEDDELQRLLGSGFMNKDFHIVVTYRFDGSSLKTDTLVGCRIKSNDYGHKQGTDALMVKHDLFVNYILHNNRNPILEMRR